MSQPAASPRTNRTVGRHRPEDSLSKKVKGLADDFLGVWIGRAAGRAGRCRSPPVSSVCGRRGGVAGAVLAAICAAGVLPPGLSAWSAAG